jgi:hypothetical protein
MYIYFRIRQEKEEKVLLESTEMKEMKESILEMKAMFLGQSGHREKVRENDEMEMNSINRLKSLDESMTPIENKKNGKKVFKRAAIRSDESGDEDSDDDMIITTKKTRNYSPKEKIRAIQDTGTGRAGVRRPLTDRDVPNCCDKGQHHNSPHMTRVRVGSSLIDKDLINNGAGVRPPLFSVNYEAGVNRPLTDQYPVDHWARHCDMAYRAVMARGRGRGPENAPCDWVADKKKKRKSEVKKTESSDGDNGDDYEHDEDDARRHYSHTKGITARQDRTNVNNIVGTRSMNNALKSSNKSKATRNQKKLNVVSNPKAVCVVDSSEEEWAANENMNYNVQKRSTNGCLSEIYIDLSLE